VSRTVAHWFAILGTALALACAEPLAAPGPSTQPDLQGRVLAGASDFTQLVAGFVHTCALTVQGSAFCWGSNDYSQLGANTSASCGGRPCSIDPVPVSGGRQYETIAAGWVTSCGVTASGEGWCWGGGPFDGRGYLGDGELSRTTTPVRVATDSALASVTLGDGHGCALTRGGTALCWGQNNLGQLGDGTSLDRAEPVAVAGGETFARLSAGAYHTCGITTDGETLCWGDNRWGQLGVSAVAFGTGTAMHAPTRVQVPAGAVFDRITAGWQHTCALDTEGSAYCWGRNDDASQLGDGSSRTHSGTPTPVTGGHRFATINAGALTTCARTDDDAGYCWGGNYYDVLATGESNDRGVPHPVAVEGGPFLRLRVGQAHACAVGTDRRLWCWGDRSAGQY
jgi:alpha-tubulin suppressor-like RCC1 family protein